MPHAENGSMAQPTVNGDKPSSQFLAHVTSYPAVSDSIDAIENNPYGKKGIELATEGYNKVVAPVVPYAQRPYGYVAPYVQKADELADGGLTKVDNTFPIVKEDTEKIKGTILDLAFMPLRMVNQGKDYVLSTYGNEYKKCGGDGYIAGGKAMITTGLVVTSDTLAWFADYLNQKKEQGKGFAKEKKDQAAGMANEKKDQAAGAAKEKKDATKEKTGN
ncbi:MAG: hypothetical protein LQ338_003840 [Usnochroma carphineum]|nr:MAG: hypothetical protein LQ338_003840 [Usnochroma carphineum]